MQKIRIAIVCGAVLLGLYLISGSDSAQARPKYPTEYKKIYPDLAKKHKITCKVCHPGKDKKKRNNYGTAISKVTKTNKKQDLKKMKEAVKKVEKEKSAIKDKTFGDLIKDGKLPASTE